MIFQEYSKTEIKVAETLLFDALDCAENKRAEMFANGDIKDESLRTALRKCGWPKPARGSLEESLEWFYIDFEVRNGSVAYQVPIFISHPINGTGQLAASPGRTGLYNFPFEAPTEDVGRGSFYLKTERNAAKISEFIAAPIRNKVLTGTTVDTIDWRQKRVKVHASASAPNDDSCFHFIAKRVLVTTSIGVLDKRGDSKYEDSDPMYLPELPKKKMKAIRMLYIDNKRRPTSMPEYRPFQLQFGKAFWDTKVEYISVDNDNGRGFFNVFQNLKHPGFFKENALKSFLVTQAYDKILDMGFDNPVNADKIVNELLQSSLGTAYPDDYFDSNDNPIYHCTRVSEFMPFPNPDLELEENECVWSHFGGVNKNWYGAYVAWRVTKGFSRRADNAFDNVFAPLRPSEHKSRARTVWFSGSAYCDYHSAFTHGGYWSGIVAMNEILQDWGYDLPVPVEETEEYKFCFKDE